MQFDNGKKAGTIEFTGIEDPGMGHYEVKFMNRFQFAAIFLLISTFRTELDPKTKNIFLILGTVRFLIGLKGK